MKIATKEDFNRLSQAGKLGNYLRTWPTLEALDASGYRGWVTIQSKDKQSPHFVPWAHTILGRITYGPTGWKTYLSVEEAVHKLIQNGASRERMYFREVPAPHARRTIQFEAMLGPQWLGAGAGIELCYELGSEEPLRGIRERGANADGLKACALINTLLSPASRDTLDDIWAEYPTAIIEATEFSERTGVFEQNLVVWEVRDF